MIKQTVKYKLPALGKRKSPFSRRCGEAAPILVRFANEGYFFQYTT